MIHNAGSRPSGQTQPHLDADFTSRLAASLTKADHERQRFAIARRARYILPYLLLAGPVLAWRLTVYAPVSTHMVIDSLGWLTFLLDVGMHMDTALLSYLNLQIVPMVVGLLLLVVVSGWLLTEPEKKK